MNSKGFTIIETLVAITVLMIAVAGPLVVANQGLTGATASKDQMIASYLAEESMEMVKNMRDNSVYSGSSWLTGFATCTPNGNLCDASVSDGNILGYANQTTPYPLYLPSNGYYSHNSGGSTTQFARSFFISAPGSLSTACTSAMTECTLTVTVSWNEGITPYSVTLSSEITSVPR